MSRALPVLCHREGGDGDDRYVAPEAILPEPVQGLGPIDAGVRERAYELGGTLAAVLME